jgi:hypothetical protein
MPETTAGHVVSDAEPRPASAESSVLEQWRNGVRIEHIAHSRAAARFEALGRALGLAVVALTAIVGTSVISTLEASPSTAVKIVAGVLAFAASALAAMQTFLGYAERAASHREVAAKYGTLRRRMDAIEASHPVDLREAMEDLQTRWDDIEASQPSTPQRLHDVARAEVLGRRAIDRRDDRGR